MNLGQAWRSAESKSMASRRPVIHRNGALPDLAATFVWLISKVY